MGTLKIKLGVMKLYLLVSLLSSVSAHGYYHPPLDRSLYGFGLKGPIMHGFGGSTSYGHIPNYYYDYFFPYGGPVDHRSRRGSQSFSFPSNGHFEGHESLYEIWKKFYRSPVQVCPSTSRSGRARYPIQTSFSLIPAALRVDPNTGIHFIEHPSSLGFNDYSAIFSQRINVPRGWSKWTRKCVAPLDSSPQTKKFPEDLDEGTLKDARNEGFKEGVDSQPQQRSGENLYETDSGVPVDQSGDSLRRTDRFDLRETKKRDEVDNFVETS